MALVAGSGVHDATVVGPLTTVSGGQVVVVQPLPKLAPETTQELTATFVVLLFEQVMSVQKLPAAAVCGVQIETGRFVNTTGGGHVVSVQKLAKVGPDTAQVWTGTFVVVTSGQIVAMNRGPVATAGVQPPTSTGVSAELLVPQVVVVQKLPGAAAAAVQVNTGTFVVVLVEQAVDVQALRAVAAEFVHEATMTLVVSIGAGQVVVVQAFVPSPVAGVQESTGTLVVLIKGQVMVINGAEFPAWGVHDAGSTAIGPVVAVAQVVVV